MGSYIRKRGSLYWTDFSFRRRRTRLRIGRVTKGYADRSSTELRAKMLLGYSVATGGSSSAISLSGLMGKTLQVSRSNNAPRTVEGEKLALQTFIDDTSVEKVSDITPVLMEDYKARRLREVSTRTVNIGLTAVKTMLYRAVHHALIPTNPVVSVKKIKGPSWKPIQFLTKEQVSALLESSSSTH